MAHARLQKQKDSFSASTVKLKNKQERVVGNKYEVTGVKQGNSLLESLRGTVKKHRFDVIGNRKPLLVFVGGRFRKTLVFAYSKS